MISTDKPLISICVTSVRAGTLPFLVQSIRSQQFQDWELLIAIQGDDQNLIQYVSEQARNDARFSFIHLDRFGKSHAINQIVKCARAEILAFTDDDCVASRDWLSTIYECFSTEPSVGIVAGDLLPTAGRPLNISTCPATRTIECIYKPSEENGFTAPPGFYFGGGNMAFRRSVLEMVGPFDEYLGGGTEFPSAEDVDYCLRAEALGVVMWTTPRSVIYHTYGRRYGIRNVLRYHRLSAVGSGALLGKLVLWNHRLAKEWGKERRATEWARRVLQNPPRAFIEMYKSKYSKTGCATFLSKYAIDDRMVTLPKSHVL